MRKQWLRASGEGPEVQVGTGFETVLPFFFALALGLSLAAPDDPASKTQPSAAEIVNKHAHCRLCAARPRKQRFELVFHGKTAIQVYDGTRSWKLRPFLSRREVEPFTAEEMEIASGQAELAGWLIDYAAKGTKIQLVGMDKVDDRDTYNVKLTTKDGNSVHMWIDARTFLESQARCFRFCETDGLSRIEKAPVLRHQARAQIRAFMQLSQPISFRPCRERSPQRKKRAEDCPMLRVG